MILDGTNLLKDEESTKAPEDRDASFDADRDSLHILPLSLIPLESTSLRRAKLVKNVRLESAVELFNDGTSGSGQYDISEIHSVLDIPKNSGHPDIVILRDLGELPSYDVYALRILLREHDIPVNDFAELQISEAKKKEVANYMAIYTRPLVTHIFGDESSAEIRDASDIMNLFRNQDPRQARQNLTLLADVLQTDLMAVPRFIEDYGDIFLSISYYKNCLDKFSEGFAELNEAYENIKGSYQVKNDPRLAAACEVAISTMANHESNMRNKLNAFDNCTEELWERISAESFRQVSRLIRGEQIQLASVLCGLTVKLAGFKSRFPNLEVAGAAKVAEYIGFEMRQNLEDLTENAKRAAIKAA